MLFVSDITSRHFIIGDAVKGHTVHLMQTHSCFDSISHFSAFLSCDGFCSKRSSDLPLKCKSSQGNVIVWQSPQTSRLIDTCYTLLNLCTPPGASHVLVHVFSLCMLVCICSFHKLVPFRLRSFATNFVIKHQLWALCDGKASLSMASCQSSWSCCQCPGCCHSSSGHLHTLLIASEAQWVDVMVIDIIRQSAIWCWFSMNLNVVKIGPEISSH